MKYVRPSSPSVGWRGAIQRIAQGTRSGVEILTALLWWWLRLLVRGIQLLLELLLLLLHPLQLLQ